MTELGGELVEAIDFFLGEEEGVGFVGAGPELGFHLAGNVGVGIAAQDVGEDVLEIVELVALHAKVVGGKGFGVDDLEVEGGGVFLARDLR